jgi:membrane dipeptidase
MTQPDPNRPAGAREGESPSADDRADARPLSVDLHMDTPTASLVDPGFDLDAETGRGHVDYPRLRRGGLSAAFFAAWVEPAYTGTPGVPFARSTEILDLTRERVDASEGGRIVRTVSDLEEARARGEIGIFLALEGGSGIEASLERLGEVADRGIRYMTLTWNDPTEWADACCGPRIHGGLTEFGREAVRALGTRGIFPDLSHASDETFWDTLEATVVPPLVSHSNSRTLADHPRNLTDDMAREVARAGGIVGLNFFPAFIDPEVALAARRLHETLDGGASNREEWTAALRALPRPPLSRLVDHFHHLADLMGPEHLALGSDFDGVATLPEGLEDVASLPVLRNALSDRGFSQPEIEGIFGVNFLRLLRSVDQEMNVPPEYQ